MAREGELKKTGGGIGNRSMMTRGGASPFTPRRVIICDAPGASLRDLRSSNKSNRYFDFFAPHALAGLTDIEKYRDF